MRMKRSVTTDPRDLIRPPCWPKDTECPNACAAALHSRVTQNHVELHGPWLGWRLAGRDLVGPSGIRVSPERMKGLMWRHESELRRDNARARNAQRKAGQQAVVTVLRINQADWHRERFGSIAG